MESTESIVVVVAGTTQLVDLYDYMATLRRMKDYAPAVLYPGHGPCIGEPGDGGYAIEFLGRYEAHRQSREDQVRILQFIRILIRFSSILIRFNSTYL